MDSLIKEYEERLRLAMISGNVDELDKLISADLVFVSHFGQIFSKDDDVDAHRQGIFKLPKINILSQTIPDYSRAW